MSLVFILAVFSQLKNGSGDSIMNRFFKYLLFSGILFIMLSNVQATYDINVTDINGAQHANKGEDFNIFINIASTMDINADFNYLIALSYQGEYVDLNVNLRTDSTTAAGSLNGGGDGNVMRKTLSGSGACENAGDVNVFVLSRAHQDNNTFDITVTVPSSGTINRMVGKEVSLEVWRLLDTTDSNTATCSASAPDANALFIIGPAIILRPLANNAQAAPGIGSIDSNMTVLGFGFDPDLNITLKFADANGTYTNDLNIQDVNHQNSSYSDANTIIDFVFSRLTPQTANNANALSTYDGNCVNPDGNGSFDVNIMLPPIPATSMPGPGGTPDNNINASNGIQDANASVVITPSLTITDENVTVGICNTDGTYTTVYKAADCSGGTFSRVSVDTAMQNNMITNMGSVKGFRVEMCSGGCSSGGAPFVRIEFNSDMNLSIGPQRNYSNNMNTANGKAKIDSAAMPEFAMDANITMYNVISASSTMPVLAKDGIVCPTTTCKNRDGSALSEDYTDASTSVQTWSYNSDAGDGNISFRVSSFSEYVAGNLTVEVITPNGGEKFRSGTGHGDNNTIITFRFKDLNTLDNNWSTIGTSTMGAILYYSNQQGAKDYIIMNDANIFDAEGIDCNSDITDLITANLSFWQTCTFDWNATDFNMAIGEYVLDVNILDPWKATTGERSVIGYGDANFFINPPMIEITDLNFFSENFVINDYINTVTRSDATLDMNYVIDFNIFLPDLNVDSNFMMSDYNIMFFYGESQYSTEDANRLKAIQGVNLDLNLVLTGKNQYEARGIICNKPVAEMSDYNCTFEWDTNIVIDKKGYLTARIFNIAPKTVYVPTQTGDTYARVVDTNELWDINSTPYAFTVNDANVPRASVAGSSTIVEGNTYIMVLTCDDNASDVNRYFFRDGSTNWFSSASNQETFIATGSGEVVKTLYGGCIDYAGNISDINAVQTVTFRLGTSGTQPPATEPPGGGSPGGGPATEPAGTETVVTVESGGTPDSETVEKTLTEAGFSQNQVQAAKQIATASQVSQTVNVVKTVSTSGETTYNTRVGITVTNSSSKKWKNVKVIVEIPKEVAEDASEITSDYEIVVLKADPIIQFVVPEIRAGQTVEVLYNIAKNISEETAGSIPLGLVTAYTEVQPCEDTVCQSEPCRTATCNPATERCEYQNKADGLECGQGMECKTGACVEMSPPVPPQPPGTDYTTLIVTIVVVLLAVIGGAYYYTTAHKKGK